MQKNILNNVLFKMAAMLPQPLCVYSLKPTEATTGSDNGLSPVQYQAIIWNNDVLMFNEPLGTNYREILIEIYKVSLKKCFESVVLEMAVISSQPQCVKLMSEKSSSPWAAILMCGCKNVSIENH